MIFGFEILKPETAPDPNQPSFAMPDTDDGAVNVIAPGGAYGTFLDLEATAKTESELINQYREMVMHHDVENAVDDIINEAISADHSNEIVRLQLDNVPYPENLRKLILAEFETILELLDFSNQSYELFRRWYIDGRINFHTIVDQTDPTLGITELRYIDPRKIRKVREIAADKDPLTGIDTVSIVREYFVYNENGFGTKEYSPLTARSMTNQNIMISVDSVVNVTSGITDKSGNMVLSHLHKAIKPLNVLKSLEDATVIYTISRAPERRIFYIDVGNLPKAKAEQYLRDMMIKHKNKLVYDSTTGAIRDDRRVMTMLEDYWFPRGGDRKGTEVETLPGGQHIGEMDHVLYFQKNLYKALNVPVSRMESDGTYALGRATEINRDEIKFNKFVNRLRLRFSMLFTQLLEKQLVLRRIMTYEEFQAIKNLIHFEFVSDNLWTELRELDIMKERLMTVQLVEQSMIQGKYYSRLKIKKDILMMDDEEIEQENEQMAIEAQEDLEAEIAAQKAKLSAFPKNPELAGAKPLPKESAS
jgi:hypothetical protein